MKGNNNGNFTIGAIALNAGYAVLTGLTVRSSITRLPRSRRANRRVGGIAAVPLNIVLHAYSSSQPGPITPRFEGRARRNRSGKSPTERARHSRTDRESDSHSCDCGSQGRSVVTILSTIEQDAAAIFAGFKPATKPTNEFIQFLKAFPFGQVLAAAVAKGLNPLLDATAAAAILSDIINSFYANKTIPQAAASVAVKIGVPAAVVSQIVFTPDPGVPSTSRGR